MATSDRPILVTGCSSGIGAATASRLLADGWTVYATARRPETLADLSAAGAKTLRLDVTDADSMGEAVRAVEEAHGAVWGLVNNAGYALQGAIETIDMTDVRRQFETNLFGPIRLTQLALPAMRRRGGGRIVNVSSMGGRITLPGGAFYHSTKHALEAFSDVLRYEVKPFGIDVSVIQPGIIKTAFADNLTEPDTEGAGPYTRYNAGVQKVLDAAYSGPLSRTSGKPEDVAKAIARALKSSRPKTRYIVTAGARAALLTHRLMSDRTWDRGVGLVYPRPERDGGDEAAS